MIDFGPHAGFILAAYGLSAAIVVALIGWVILDGRAQRQRLADLEARGIRRRSSRKPADVGGSPT